MYRHSSSKNDRNRRLRFELMEDRRVLAPVTVDTTNDDVDVNLDFIDIPTITSPGGAGPDGVISLREAVAAANNSDNIGGPDTINFAPGLTGTIALDQAFGEFAITDALTIQGPGRDNLTIDAGGNSRIFNIDVTPASMATKISGLTLTDGDAVGNGGVIQSVSSLNLSSMAIENSYASDSGGGVYVDFEIAASDSGLWMTDVLVSNNVAEDLGGGIFVRSYAGQQVDLNRIEVVTNEAKGLWGGGIYSQNGDSENGIVTRGGNFTLRNSTIKGNLSNSNAAVQLPPSAIHAPLSLAV